MTFVIFCFVSIVYIWGLKYVTLNDSKNGIENRYNGNGIFVVLFMIAFAVLRKVDFGVGGTDAVTYVIEFKSMTGDIKEYLNWDRIIALKSREPFYIITTWIIRKLTDSYKIYFVICYGIIANNFVYFLKNRLKKNNCIPSLLLLVAYIHSFNVMRNWIAISFLMLASVFWENEKKFRSILSCVCAVCFHYSTFIIIVFYAVMLILEKVKLTRTKLYVFWGILTFVVSSSDAFVQNFMSGTKYNSYIGSASSYIGYIPILFITGISIFYYSQIDEKIENGKRYVLLSIVNSSLLHIYVAMGGYRINDSFVFVRVYLLIALYEVTSNINNTNRKLIPLLIQFFTIVYSLQQIMNVMQTSGVVPYIIG